MTGMDDAIEKAAKLVDEILCRDPQVAREMFGDEPDRIARALAAAGLLAPTPLREDWGVQSSGAVHVRRDRTAAEGDCRSGEAVVRRYVSDWLPADSAEGDGSEP